MLEGYPLVVEQKVAWRDLDAYGHVNNAIYGSYIENARIEYYTAIQADTDRLGTILAEQTITYKSPAFLRETLLVGTRVAEIRNSSFVMESEIFERETGRLVATARSILVHYDYTEKKSKPLPNEWREIIGRFEGRKF